MKKIAIIFVFLITSSVAYSFERPVFSSFRSMGMGGSNITFFDNEYTILNNPANLAANSNKDFILPLMEVYFNSKLYQLYKSSSTITASMNSDTPDYSAVSDILTSLKGAFFDAGIGQLPLIPVSFYNKNFGFSINTNLDMQLALHKLYDVLNLYADGSLQEDAQLTIGYGRSIKLPLPLIDDIKVGASAGYLNRLKIDIEHVDSNKVVINGTTYLIKADTAYNSKTTKDIGTDISGNISNYLKSSPFFNVGASASILKFVGASMTVQNIGSSIEPATMNVGGVLKPLYLVPSILFVPINSVIKIIDKDDAKVVLEMHDVFGKGFFEKLHAGIELSAIHLFGEPMVFLDLGLNYGYPAFGIGVEAWFIKFYYASATYEEGSYLGAKPNVINKIGLQLKF